MPCVQFSQPVNASEPVGRVMVEDAEMYPPRRLYEPTHKFTRIFPPCRHSQRQHCMHDNNNSLHPSSHSWTIVCLWRPTISRFSHVRQLIPLSLRLLDSALVVWICRRAESGGTMLSPCPTLLIKPIHKSKILPTATQWDNEGLSAVRWLRLRLSSINLTWFVCTPLMGVTLKMWFLSKSI